jgi:TraM recognition site of TraD and TraG/Helicase HerA, central domain
VSAGHPYYPPPPRPSPAVERFLLEPDWPVKAAGGYAAHALAGGALLLVPVALCVLGAIVGVLLLRWVHRRGFAREARLVQIGVPPEVNEKGGQLLWGALHDLLRPPSLRLLLGQPHLSWEIASSEAGTTFRLWVPKVTPPGLIERAVSAAWPGANVTTEPADAAKQMTAPRTVQVTSELALSGPGWFSLNTSLSPDPLPLILGQLSGLTGPEHALVQMIARPATAREQHRLRAAARRIRRGHATGRLLRLVQLFQIQPPAPPQLDPTIAPDVREAMVKSTGSLYRCTVRVTVTASSRAEARGRIHAVLGAFAPYNGTRVFLCRRHVFRAVRKLDDRRPGWRAFLLGVPELAALAHLPAQQAIPGVVMAGAREVAPPPGLPTHGKPLGRGANGRQVNLAVKDARQHLHVLGPTGVGKSTLIARLVLADFDAGLGAVVIDPKGDLVEDLLARIPPGREGEVDLLDPMDPAPPGLNVLDSPDRDLGVDQLVGIFRRVFERFWGPRTDDVFRAALLTLSKDKDATLADVPRLLGDDEFRATLVSQLEDPVGLEPFWAWYQGLSEAVRAQAIGPLLNKLRAFLLRGPVRAIVGQPRTTLDIPRALNEGRLLLARLPKGTLGEDTSRLLGSMIVARVWQAALARAAVAQEQRADAALYVDEVQNFLNLPTPIPDVLAEARGYRLSLVMAHQHLGQLTRELREGIAANARTKVYFQVSREDAQALEREVRPELAAHDLAHLPVYTAAVRLCHDGQTSRAFTIKTEALPDETPGQVEMVRAANRGRIGVPREQTEQRLAERQRTTSANRKTRKVASAGGSVLPSGPAGASSSDSPSDLGTEHPRRRERPANVQYPAPDSTPDKGSG